MKVRNSLGIPKHSYSNEVSSIFCLIYFFLCFAERLDYGESQGKEPFKKYISIIPKDSRSSLLECLCPLNTFRLENLEGPIILSGLDVSALCSLLPIYPI